jgi:hypothetical protein
MCFVGDFISEYRNDAGARPWDRRRPLIVAKPPGNAPMESFVSKPPHGLKPDRSLMVAAMRASATNPDTKPTFPYGTP